ncbi:patatin-like phospholipase family protein [Arthrobacter sp. zg-ZUI100]|uniref:patatin-like phospholipase family protein n=1 Tax=Arthrobacter jiangjiafuii TaxID=2817475 RepID=UPI001AEDDE8C|nr:patatin-like phospholipase family protein [Arthrobacter jiangjiafuii]MBP3037627.1 patatin-like phospholipase family protein [Arthrobacter jiangjiafuii]
MTDSVRTRAVVLGGGGVAGIAWEMGVLATLMEQGIDLDDADLVVGTSAGSVVGVALRFGVLRQVLAAQFREDDPAETAMEQGELSHFSTEAFMDMMADAARGPGGEEAARARIGREALAAGRELSEEDWVTTIRSLLPAQQWPERPLQITAVNADDGAFTVFDAASGVDLALAVAASCCVPGAWPPVHINGAPYMDGGMRSATNADIAGDYDKVLVLSCGPEAPDSPFGPTLPQVLEQLKGRTETFLIDADAASLAAFGTNLLLQSTRRPSAEAGQRQAAAVADDVKAFWGAD